MDRIIPTFIVVCLIVLGYIVKLFEMKDLEERFVFTDEYRKKFITLCNDIITRDYFNQEIYFELTSVVKNMQEELGSDGVYAYAKDNLTGIATKNYQLLVNFLPELRTAVSEKQNSIIAMRLNKSMSDCDDMFIRHMGSLNVQKETVKKQVKNPFSCFSEGIKFIICLPILILNWLGLIGASKSLKIKNNWIIKMLNSFFVIIGFIGSIITIVIGWMQFVQIIKNLF